MHNITIACGAITAKLGQIAIYFTPAQHCKGAGWTDVIIAVLVCGTIAAIAIVGLVLYFRWKNRQLKEEMAQKKTERDWAIDDAKRKQIAEYRKLLLEIEKGNYPGDDHPYVKELKGFISNP